MVHPMTDPMRDALRECEEYFEERADAEYHADSASPTGNEEMRLLVAVQAALRTPSQPAQGFRAGAYERHIARTPRIVSDEMVVENVRRAIEGIVFELTQPDRGDVFSWVDDHASEIARAVLAAMEPSK